jgi:hypothetical protein
MDKTAAHGPNGWDLQLEWPEARSKAGTCSLAARSSAAEHSLRAARWRRPRRHAPRRSRVRNLRFCVDHDIDVACCHRVTALRR